MIVPTTTTTAKGVIEYSILQKNVDVVIRLVNAFWTFLFDYELLVWQNSSKAKVSPKIPGQETGPITKEFTV